LLELLSEKILEEKSSMCFLLLKSLSEIWESLSVRKFWTKKYGKHVFSFASEKFGNKYNEKISQRGFDLQTPYRIWTTLPLHYMSAFFNKKAGPLFS
jgi:hypothetical protein